MVFSEKKLHQAVMQIEEFHTTKFFKCCCIYWSYFRREERKTKTYPSLNFLEIKYYKTLNKYINDTSHHDKDILKCTTKFFF